MNLVGAICAASERGATMTFRHPDGSEVSQSVAELLARGRGAASRLQDGGVKAGSVVAVVGPAGLDLISAWFAVLSVGAIPTLMAPPNHRQNADLWVTGMRHLVSYTGAAAVIVDDLFRDAIDAALDDGEGDAGKRLSTQRLLASPEAALSAPADPPADAIALLQHSSGTTGLHKGVALSSRALLTQVELYAEALQLDPATDRIASWLPIYHDMGLIACLVLPLVKGVDLVWMDNFEWARQPGLLLDAISRHRSTLCWLPNFAFSHLASLSEDGDWDLGSVRLWTNCSEPVKAASFDRFVERFAAHGVTPSSLGSSYALAENTFAATQSPPGEAPRRRAQPGDDRLIVTSSGRPLRDHVVQVRAPDTGSPVDDGQIGEIWLRSPCLMAGYFRRDTPALQDGWYATGDLGFFDESELYVCGRARDMAIIAGKNVFPEDVEAILGRLEGLHPGRSVAFGVDDDARGTQRLIALSEPEGDDLPDRKAQRGIVRAARDLVAEQIGVRLDELRIVPARTLLKSSAGKLSRDRCRDLYLSWQESGATPS